MSVLDIPLGRPLANWDERAEQIGVSSGIPIFGPVSASIIVLLAIVNRGSFTTSSGVAVLCVLTGLLSLVSGWRDNRKLTHRQKRALHA